MSSGERMREFTFLLILFVTIGFSTLLIFEVLRIVQPYCSCMIDSPVSRLQPDEGCPKLLALVIKYARSLVLHFTTSVRKKCPVLLDARFLLFD